MDAMPQRFYLKNHHAKKSRFVFRYDVHDQGANMIASV
jgi:hypothetical protein